jgi:hypothetical protein
MEPPGENRDKEGNVSLSCLTVRPQPCSAWTQESASSAGYCPSRWNTVFSTFDQALERGSMRSKWPAVEISR